MFPELLEEHRLRVFENRVLRRIFGPEELEMAGGWRKLYNEQLTNLGPSPNIIRVMKSRRVRWAEQLAQMGEMRNAYDILLVKLKGSNHVEDQGINGKVIIELFLGK
jgi:hypothetical protein